ncbi:hypothetical protein BO78DRAFT_467933 [Aspergillus sclerotiicarbonarius CBS 121057]|uniref:C2H2-type domain-containing protein n=1 Tax=Aspergillus sclerotiicarbonarius (strain CBS 121057 / IBT 28362) TaxID=1448318 RepID=A0A319EGB4_ASPSB|nr:hypothetical protein BO78DRAFT_467933 [Aspergillus sclerotiicarbonarius CBS 121057]
MASTSKTTARPISKESLAIVPLLEACRNISLLMNEGWAASQLLKFQTTWILKLRIGPTSNGLLDEETLCHESEIQDTLPVNVSHLRKALEVCMDTASSRPPSPTESDFLDKYQSDGDYDADDDSACETDFPRNILTNHTAGSQPYTPTSPTNPHFQQWKGEIQRTKGMVETRLQSLQYLADQVENIHYRKLCKLPDSKFRRRDYAHLGDEKYKQHAEVDVEDLLALRKRVLDVLFECNPHLGGDIGPNNGATSRLSDVSDQRLQSVLQVVYGVLRRRNRFTFWRRRDERGGVSQTKGRGWPVLGSLIHARWPAPPVLSEGETTFRCPICGDTLLRAESEHGNWEIHVSHDLAPYTCFIPGCNKSSPFRQREDLQTHLEEKHGRMEYWKCLPCSMHGTYREFRTKDDLLEHLDLDHPTFDRSRESGRPPVKLTRPAGIRECPLCFLSAEEAWDPEQFLDHVGVHLRDLALLAVPGVEVSDGGGDGDEGMALDGEVWWC